MLAKEDSIFLIEVGVHPFFLEQIEKSTRKKAGVGALHNDRA